MEEDINKVKQIISESKNLLEDLKHCEKYISYKSIFHSIIESLQTVFQISDSNFKNILEGQFFPEVIKIIRENKFHYNVDAFSTGATSIPGLSSSFGPLRIRNYGTININGDILPQGDIVFGDRINNNFENTLNGNKNDILNKVPTIVQIKMKDLCDIKLKKSLKNIILSKNPEIRLSKKQIKDWQLRLNCYIPDCFLEDAIDFYENVFNK